ncbi:ribonuclease J [uncultured Desulfuromonas sp.]|uniref:ribonuclease J n=1 Tax=uncultured Desulfuromonas sp. TaxID=181013 RepID=UPI00374CFA32
MLPLGGLGEIGLNMMALEYAGNILLIDCGLMFPEAHMLGIDLVLPDISCLAERLEDICGLVITHGHEDHIGAIPFLYEQLGRPPLYATRFTLALLKKKLEEFELNLNQDMTQIAPRETFDVGPFTVEPFRVAHSVPDGVGLAIRCPAGLVVHSGDFKLDATPLDGQTTDVARLAQYGEEGVLLLLADSTNVETPGFSGSERDVGPRFRDIMEQACGLVFVATFSSNIHRIQQAIDAALACGRKVALFGRSMVSNCGVARIYDALKIPESELVDVRQIADYPRNQVAVITTGSQGEPRSALARLAADDHPQFAIEENDCVILSSRFIPGNEKAITSVINQLYRLGAEVHYQRTSGVHVSGHASREELKQLLALVRPQSFIPIHGEFRHLIQHARLAQQMGVAQEHSQVIENGQPVLVSSHGLKLLEAVESGRVLVDGKGVGDVGMMELRDRHRLARHGTVMAVLAVSRSKGTLLHGPELVSRGCLPEPDSDALLAEAAEKVRDMLAEHHLSSLTDWDDVRIEIRQTLTRFFKRRLQRRPLVLPIIIQL